MYVRYRVRCRLRDDSRLVANFPENLEAIDYIVKREAKENGLTEEEAEKLKAEMREDLANAVEEEEEEEKKLTKMIFIRDDKGIYLRPRHIKGWLKESLKTLGVRGYREAVNHGVFVEPSRIYLMRDGKNIKQADDILYQPISVVGIRGPRSSIKVAEVLYPPVEWEFYVYIVDHIARRVLTEAVMEKAFKVGEHVGFLGDRSLQEGQVEVEFKKS